VTTSQGGLGLHRGRPGATLAFNASATIGECAAPQANRVLAHAKASATRGLVQPDGVSNIARARSASPRSRECLQSLTLLSIREA
jgi:hypothetical protein